jgi:protein-tyrosine-phosphatase
MADRPFNVLFLCTGNSARSIIAEAILNRIGQGKFRAYSAGSQPKGEVNPQTIALLKSLNHDVTSIRSKSWSEFARPGAPPLDFVFTVCDDAANEACPVWPGQPMTAHWGLPDPAKATGTDAEIASASLLRCRSRASTSSACSNGCGTSAAWRVRPAASPSRADDAGTRTACFQRMAGHRIPADGRGRLRHHGATPVGR